MSVIDPVTFIGEIVVSGTSGSILYVDSTGHLAQDNAALKWTDASGLLDISVSQNAGTTVRITNSNAVNTAASASVYPKNSNGGLFLATMGAAFTTSGILVQNYGVISTDSALSGLAIGNIGNNPTIFYNNNVEAMRITGAGVVSIQNLTASQAVFTDSSKNLISKAVTGTSNVVLSTAPTMTGPVTIAAPASGSSLTVSGVAGNYALNFLGPNTAGSSYGVLFQVGTNTGDYIIRAQNAAGVDKWAFDGAGNFGLGTPSPSAQFHTTGTARMANFGAGAATFDASGNISSVSDERLKDIQDKYLYGIEVIEQIEPILYKWNKESGMETEHTYLGFSAQNVQKASKYLAGENSQGYLSVQDRAILATLVNAVKDLNNELSEIRQHLNI